MAQRLVDLFPPAAPPLRLDSARDLAACATPKVEGALAAALRNEPEPAIRAAIVESMSRLQSAFVKRTLARAQRDPDPNVRAKADAAVAAAAQREEAAAQEEAQQAATASATAAVPKPAEPIPSLTIPTTPVADVPTQAEALDLLAEALAAKQAADSHLTLLPPTMGAPVAPQGPVSGVPLLITTSLLAGGAWGAGLAVMADQNSPGVMLLLGSAGAVIGGGTAVALSRFGVRPEVGQAIWFSNASAWGGLAGLMAYAGSGANDSRLQAGLLVGGESLGLALGAWSASRYKWSPAQTALADGLVIGSALTVMGLGHWQGENDGIPAWMGYGTAPVMLGAAVLAQHLSPTKADARFIALSSSATSLTLGLISSGLQGTHLVGSHQGQGGLIAGLGFGFVASTLVSPWVEPTTKQLNVASGSWLAGAAFGMGSFMLAFPDEDDTEHRNFGAALGAASFATAGYILAPRLHLGTAAAPLIVSGAALSSGLWALAFNSTSGNVMTGDQARGGALALAVGGGLAGAWASNYFTPTPTDFATAAAATLAGASGGLGLAMLTSSHDGGANFAGVLVGGTAGLSLSAWANHHETMRAPALWAGAAGGLYGFMVADHLYNITQENQQGSRSDEGATYLGLSLGVLAGTSAARLTHATTGQVFVPTIAMGLGMAMGAGAGDVAGGGEGARIGSTAAGLGLAATSLLVDRHLKLSKGLGPTWLTMGVWGGLLGGFQGLLLADLAQEMHDEYRGDLSSSGWLAGTAAGLTTGLVLSKLARPTARDYTFTAGGSLLGLSLGIGLANAFDASSEASAALRFGGSFGGLVSAAALAHAIKPTKLDLAAEVIGAGYGFALGALVTDLGKSSVNWNNTQTAGASLGMGIGATGAVAATHALGASTAQVTTVTAGTTLGAMAGLGLGMAWRQEETQAARIGTTVGLSAGLLGTLAADHWMNFSGTPFAPRAQLALAATAFGAYQGILLGRALSYEQIDLKLQERQRLGSLMFGGAAGAATGLLLSNVLHPNGVDILVTGAGSAVGSLFGTGAAWVFSSPSAQTDAWATLAGSMSGMVAAGAMQRYAPLTTADAGASALGLSLGALVGGLAPALHRSTVTTSNRLNVGGLMLGASAGSVLGVITRKATGAEGRTVATTAWGAWHGAITGLQVGALIDDENETKARRLGAIAGAASGTALGALLWKRNSFANQADRNTTVAASALGAWTGWWTSQLLPNRDAKGTEFAGVVAGAGLGSMLAISAAPYVNISDDVLTDAITMNVLVAGVSGGVATMTSTNERAAPAAVIAGGTAGLLLGSVLHDRITLASKGAPLLYLSITQGAFAGLLLPSLLYDEKEQTNRRKDGAIVVGTLGGATIGLLLTSAVTPTKATAALSGLGSATGAAIGGGIGLVSDDFGPQGGAAMALGGSALGLTAGALAARSNPPVGTVFKASAVGASLGAAEGAVFSWAARGTSRDDYAGSMLVGAGLGTTLALASTVSETWQIPASAGFGAWGAWIGSFSGALVKRSPQEVTFGGLVGLNVGVAAGYGALTAKWIEPSDFGWLSLFGAAGTLVGGSTGALLSSSQNPQPAFVGLAVGPIAGLAVGAFMLPTWRRLRGPETNSQASADETSLAHQAVAVDSAAPPRGDVVQWAHKTNRRLSSLIEVDQVMPLVGAMPTDEQSGGPTPFVLGLTGKWR